MTKSLNEIKKKVSPEILKVAEEKTKQLLMELLLQKLRHARELSQEQIAGTLPVNQAAISKLERRTDMYISTLRNFIRAMGGDLEIRAIFPEGIVKINQFHSIIK